MCSENESSSTMENAVCLSHAVEDGHIPFIRPVVEHGSHCPLFGVVMAVPFVQGVATLVVGTAECCWHCKNQYFGNGGSSLFYTYVLDDSEIVFGAAEGVSKAIRAIWEETRPQAVQLVTSCIPELIGESAEKIAAMADVPVPVITVRTNHYSQSGYYSGLSGYYSSFVSLMERTEQTDDVVLLGVRYEGVECSEIYGLLLEQGKRPVVPTNVDEMRRVPNAALVVVMDVTALDVARKVCDRFGTSYVRLDRLCRPDDIRNAYREIDGIIGTDLVGKTADLHQRVVQKILAARQSWERKRFVCAAPFFLPLEASLFFTDLGMEPEFVLLREFFHGDNEWAQELLEQGFDPYVASFASMGELEEKVFDLGISLFFGPTHLQGLERSGILNVNPNRMTASFGYQIPLGILQQMNGSAGQKRGRHRA